MRLLLEVLEPSTAPKEGEHQAGKRHHDGIEALRNTNEVQRRIVVMLLVPACFTL